MTHQIYGSYEERQRRSRWLATRPCRECERQDRLAEAEEAAAQMGLPALSGTEKQVAWATTLRQELLRKVEEHISRHLSAGERAVAAGAAAEATLAQERIRCQRLYDRLKTQSSAAWWIDRRGYTAQELLREVEEGPHHAE